MYDPKAAIIVFGYVHIYKMSRFSSHAGTVSQDVSGHGFVLFSLLFPGFFFLEIFV